MIGRRWRGARGVALLIALTALAQAALLGPVSAADGAVAARIAAGGGHSLAVAPDGSADG